MQSKNKIFLILIIAFLIIVGCVLSSQIPKKASVNDKIVEDIGGDSKLIVTLEDCLKTKEENISDGNLNGIACFSAKNISFVDFVGNNANMIIWKSSGEKYNISGNNIQYLSGSYGDSVYFLKYYPENDNIYGIILNGSYTLDELIYDILNQNSDETPKTNSYIEPYEPNARYNSYDIDESPYALAKNDPDWYYDHYEYEDNYDIDDYLESEGYD